MVCKLVGVSTTTSLSGSPSSSPWNRSTCCFNFSFLENVIPHIPHSNGLIWSWTTEMWRSKLRWLWKLLLQTVQTKYWPWCWHRTWFTRSGFRLNLLLQCSQAYGIALLWINRIWFSIPALAAKLLPQVSHTNGLCFSCTIRLWAFNVLGAAVLYPHNSQT